MTTLDRDLNEKAMDAAVESFGDFFDDYVSDSTYPALRAAITAYLDALSSIPEQGVGVPVEVTAHKIVYAVHRMQRDKKAVDSQVRFVMSVLAPSHPAAVAVTDEMVERACRHTEQGWDAYLAKGGSYLRWADERRAEMRQTLVAALVDRDRVK